MSKTVASPRKTGVETAVGRLLPRDARTGIVAVPAPAQRPTHGTAATIRRVVRQVIAESAPRNG
ncbi:MAG: hypothetical protein NTW56_04955 [Alphaproteobacteria bacterium]|nr:hypothetical protein [Alphaproteobacteria bacterium]